MTLTDIELGELVDLDDVPGCAFRHCDVDATHLAVVTCGCSTVICAPHADALGKAILRIRDWTCAMCKARLGIGCLCDFVRVVPL